jgi:hypothetical protein
VSDSSSTIFLFMIDVKAAAIDDFYTFFLLPCAF